MSVSEAHSGSPPRLMAAGEPISEATADAAAQWLTLLMSGESTDGDRQRWEEWRNADPDNERAWKHIEAVTGRLRAMEPQAAYRALSPYAGPESPGRRSTLLLWGSAIGASGVLASQTHAWQQRIADYRTGIGEQRTVLLNDGTSILLNTASAINVQFNAERRVVRLVAGEIMIATGHALAAEQRPFIVETAQGRIRALGTRFTVRQVDERIHVAVLQSAVAITLVDASGAPQVLHAGERAAFGRDVIGATSTATEADSAWTRGQMVLDSVRLGDFVADLARYRPGIVRCEASVAEMRVSGVFPLGDTDRIFAMLPKVLPVQVRLRTRYWVTVEAPS